MCSYERFWCGELSPELLIVHLHLFFQKVLVRRIGSRTVYSPFTFVLPEGSGSRTVYSPFTFVLPKGSGTENWVQNCL